MNVHILCLNYVPKGLNYYFKKLSTSEEVPQTPNQVLVFSRITFFSHINYLIFIINMNVSMLLNHNVIYFKFVF